MRLIDADALAASLGITNMECLKCGWYNGRGCKRGSDFVDACEAIEDAPTIEPDQRWIPVSERLPECEQEVLICTMKRVYVSKKTGMDWCEEPVITPALYEDGTMLEVNSKWRWEDIDYAGWDEEEDCGIIPEGWWENRHFNPDEVYNNIVDKKVVAWMPLPEPYKESSDGE